MTVTVVIPAFNAERFLPAAVASIREQRFEAPEIIVVNDGSSDRTAAVARALGTDVQVITQENAGAAGARNTGVAAASGELIAFLDADDLWPPDHLALLGGRLAETPEALMTIGRTQLFRDGLDGAPAPVGPPWHAPVFGAGLFRRAAFDRVGRMDPAMQPAEDLDWFIRAREAGVATVVLEETTLWYRWHTSSLTSGADPIRRRLLVALKRSLDRRRAEAGVEVRKLSAQAWLPAATPETST